MVSNKKAQGTGQGGVANAPAQRLKQWVEYYGLSINGAAERLGIHRVALNQIMRGVRVPGRRVANRIEAKTKRWQKGAIKASEWD